MPSLVEIVQFFEMVQKVTLPAAEAIISVSAAYYILRQRLAAQKETMETGMLAKKEIHDAYEHMVRSLSDKANEIRSKKGKISGEDLVQLKKEAHDGAMDQLTPEAKTYMKTTMNGSKEKIMDVALESAVRKDQAQNGKVKPQPVNMVMEEVLADIEEDKPKKKGKKK